MGDADLATIRAHLVDDDECDYTITLPGRLYDDKRVNAIMEDAAAAIEALEPVRDWDPLLTSGRGDHRAVFGKPIVRDLLTEVERLQDWRRGVEAMHWPEEAHRQHARASAAVAEIERLRAKMAQVEEAAHAVMRGADARIEGLTARLRDAGLEVTP